MPKSGTPVSWVFGFISAALTLFVARVFGIPFEFAKPQSFPLQTDQSIEISWQLISPKEPKPQRMKFMEANPVVPENAPDKTSNFSFQDQQAAQPETQDEEGEKIPRVEGEEENVKIIPSSKDTVSNSPAPPTISLPKATSHSSSDDRLSTTQSSPPKSQIDQESPSNGKGIKLKRNERIGEDQRIINLSKGISQTDNALAYSPNISYSEEKPKPRTRPKLSPDLLSGPLMKTWTNAPRVGTIAIECRLHPYGVYLQEMLQSIEEQWHQLAKGSMRYLKFDQLPPKITYRFKLMANGSIQSIERLDEEDSSIAAELCRQAIASRVPFGEWTDRMIQDFGKSDEITISFSYR